MWDPQQYRAFRGERDRPGYDLLARVGATTARRVVDLGCGTGNLTGALSARWPDAVVEALDSDAEMVEAARSAGIDAQQRDLREWRPAAGTDVVVCNAVLHWIPEHVGLLRSWLGQLPAGAWFAFQVPGNFEAASHLLARELAGEPAWRNELADRLRVDSVLSPTGYADLLVDLGTVDVWETTYLHRLSGADPVLEWITGTALRPVREVLDAKRWHRFRAELAPRLRAAYPPRGDGTTWFPFRRIFAIVRRHGGKGAVDLR